MKLYKVAKICKLINEQKKLLKRDSSSSKSKNNKVVEEDEMNVTTLNPGAPIDNLESGDFYAPGDFRIPKILGKVQRRRKTKK